MPKNTRLPGHALRSEGNAYIQDTVTGGWCRNRSDWDGVGLCSCGATPPDLMRNNERKRWHALHKQQILGLSASPDEEG